MRSRSLMATLPVSAILVILVTSMPAGAATDLEIWQGKVGKSASSEPAFPTKPKGKCICRASGLFGQVGAIRQLTTTLGGFTRVYVDCLIPVFDPVAGSSSGFLGCGSDFFPLPK